MKMYSLRKRLVWSQSCTYGLFTLCPILLFTIVALWNSKTSSDNMANLHRMNLRKTFILLNMSHAIRSKLNESNQAKNVMIRNLTSHVAKLGNKNSMLKESLQTVEQSALNLTSKLLLKDVAAELSEKENQKLRKEVSRLQKITDQLDNTSSIEQIGSNSSLANDNDDKQDEVPTEELHHENGNTTNEVNARGTLTSLNSSTSPTSTVEPPASMTESPTQAKTDGSLRDDVSIERDLGTRLDAEKAARESLSSEAIAEEEKSEDVVLQAKQTEANEPEETGKTAASLLPQGSGNGLTQSKEAETGLAAENEQETGTSGLKNDVDGQPHKQDIISSFSEPEPGPGGRLTSEDKAGMVTGKEALAMEASLLSQSAESNGSTALLNANLTDIVDVGNANGDLGPLAEDGFNNSTLAVIQSVSKGSNSFNLNLSEIRSDLESVGSIKSSSPDNLEEVAATPQNSGIAVNATKNDLSVTAIPEPSNLTMDETTHSPLMPQAGSTESNDSLSFPAAPAAGNPSSDGKLSSSAEPKGGVAIEPPLAGNASLEMLGEANKTQTSASAGSAGISNLSPGMSSTKTLNANSTRL